MAGRVPAIPIPETPIMKPGYVYILASRPGGAIYVGVTSNLVKRVAGHKNKLIPGRTKQYGIDKLVHFEAYDDIRDAIQREKNIKHWSHAYKMRLILQSNPAWRNLYDDATG
jgi:putative endonuclease